MRAMARRPFLLGLLLAAFGGSASYPAAPVPPSTAARVASQQESPPAESSPDVERPTLDLTVRPRTGFAPARFTIRGLLTGGPDDFEEYYCPTVEWDWGNGTTSEASYDCDPYEAGKSEIRRRFTTQYVFNHPGIYKIRLILKRKDETLVAANTQVRVRPGLRTR